MFFTMTWLNEMCYIKIHLDRSLNHAAIINAIIFFVKGKLKADSIEI